MKKRIYKNLLALTLACSVALSTAPVSSFARDVAAVSESEATTEAPKEKATEVEKKTEVSKRQRLLRKRLQTQNVLNLTSQ